jgi:tripartite-type tricarboxylate transporter receptor subunit TctC
VEHFFMLNQRKQEKPPMNHKTMSRRRSPFFSFASAAIPAVALLTLGTQPAVAQDHPSKPIRVVLEFVAGAQGDINMRSVTGQWSRFAGQPVVVENRPGAGGVLAVETVIRAAPDGYTLLGSTTSALILRPHLVKSNTIDMLRDLTPITGLWSSPSILVVSAGLPINSVKELIDYARANPGKVTYGTTGIGTTHHFNGEQVQFYTGLQLRHIPYKPNNQNFIDAAAGELTMVIGNYGVSRSILKTEKIRLLAVIEGRSSILPGTPGLGELIPGFSAVPNPAMLFGPANLPDAIVRRINADVVKALVTQDVKNVITDGDTIGETPEAFRARLQTQMAVVAKIAKAANIQPTD